MVKIYVVFRICDRSSNNTVPKENQNVSNQCPFFSIDGEVRNPRTVSVSSPILQVDNQEV